jgi:NAD(P)-dependent dehydrogenase (short-subunit alcohol dehydrogenase family)
MDLKLTGKVAVVAGGSKGIGAATARLLAEEGAKLLLTARGPEALAATAQVIHDATGAEVQTISADLSAPGPAEDVAKAALDAYGRIDILVNSAGAARGGAFESLSDEVWADALNLKFFGTMRMVRAVLPAMRARKYGRIVNVAGNTGSQPHPGLLPGGCANAALLSFTKGLSEDIVKDGIVMNALQPGPARTEHWDTLMTNLSRGTGLNNAEFETEFLKLIPMGRTAEAGEMAQMIVFLASDTAAYMTGRSVIVDGGWTAAMA